MDRRISVAAATLFSLAAFAHGQTSAPATRPASFAAVEAWLDAAKRRDVKAVRESSLVVGAPDRAEQMLAMIEAGEFPPRGELALLETIERGDCAIALVRFAGRGGRADIQDLPMIRVGDTWKVALFEPSPDLDLPAEHAQHEETFDVLRVDFEARKTQLLAAMPVDPAAAMDTRRREMELSKAVAGGKVDEVRRLLDAGASAEGSGGTSPLKKAIEGGHREVATLLIERGARLRPSWVGDWLQLSTGGSRARLAVELGLDVNAPIEGGPDGLATPLLTAVLAGDAELATLMIARGGKLVDQERLATTFLNAAATSRDLSTFEVVAAAYPDWKLVDRDGRSPLHAVSERPGVIGGKDGGAIVDRLLAAELDPRAESRSKFYAPGERTPLMMAMRGRQPDVVATLLKHVRFEPAELNAALMLARGGPARTVDDLIAAGATPATAGDATSTPLHEAAVGIEAEAKVRSLVRAGAGVDRRTEPDGRTPLHQAVAAGRPETVRALLELGADPRAKDAAGHDAAALATIRGERGIESTVRGERTYRAEPEAVWPNVVEIARLVGVALPTTRPTAGE